MAEEAFALSPISARASQPREEDYEAIREAFMETSRGRWFLGEYAKRNRNADTRLVLDAVARIENGLAAQKQSAAESGLAEALDAIKSAIDQARSAVADALEQSSLQDALAPVGKGARIIREISWRWREIGADSRICDLIDSQISAIEEACGQIASTDPKAALIAAFDLLEQRIAEFGLANRPVAAAAANAPSPSGSANQTYAAPSAAVQVEEIGSEGQHAMNGALAADNMARQKPAAATAGILDVQDEPEMTAEAARAQDEALLDMVALEMAAPDPEDSDDAFVDPDVLLASEPPPVEAEAVAELPEPAAPQANEKMQRPFQSPPERSLGSSLIETGIVRKPTVSSSDPLAPIRRMSQAERIALFS
jgi:hypothetical protein